MTETMQKIVRDRAEHLLASFNNQALVPPKMALGSLDIMNNVAALWGGQWKNIKINQCWFFLHNTEKVKSSVWVAPNLNDHSGAYKEFVSQTYGIQKPILPSGLDIDHLQAKATLPHGSIVRLEAVASTSNRSHGAGVEKRMSDSKVSDARKAANHTSGSMTWLVALKLAGVLSPKIGNSPSAQERQTAAIEYFASKGWNEALVKQGLDGLTEVADRR